MGFLFFLFFFPLIGVFAVLFWTMVAGYLLVKFVSYIFQSFGLLRIARREGYGWPYLVWLPVASDYVLGKYCMGRKWTLAYSLMGALRLVLTVLVIALGGDALRYCFLGFTPVYFLADMLCMNRFYKKVYQAPELYTILTVITLGLLKPFFIYMARVRKLTKVELG